MNRMLVRSLICGGSLSILTSLATAQQPPGQNPATTRNTQRAAPGTALSQQMTGVHPLRLSQVIGTTVNSAQGRQIGQIQDVVIDPMTGRIDFAVLSMTGSGTTPGATTPGAPGANTTSQRLVPMPWQLFSRSFTGTGTTAAPGTTDATAQRALTLNLDETRLQNAPALDQNNWNQFQQPDFGQRLYSYYGLDWNRRGMTGTGAPGPGTSTGTGTSGTRTPATPGTTTPGATAPGTTTPTPGTPGTTPAPGTPPGGTAPPK